MDALEKDEIPDVPNCPQCNSSGINIDAGSYFLCSQLKGDNRPDPNSGIPLICTFCRNCGLVRFYKRSKTKTK